MTRHKNDFYPTPEALTLALLDVLHTHHPIGPNTAIYEPCAGMGHISNVLKTHSSFVLTADIDENMPVDLHLDARYDKPTVHDQPCVFDWIITNPPFNSAFDILNNMLEIECHQGIAMLLRLSFLEPAGKRKEFLAVCPPTDLIVLPRTSFTEDGKTDSVTCAWMVWRKHQPDKQTIQIYTKADLQHLMEQ